MRLDPAKLIAAHARLLAGDRTASAAIIEVAYKPLIGFALSKYREKGLDEDKAKDIALDALVALIENPQGYDASKGASLFTYLCMCVAGDVLNAFAKALNRSELFSTHAVEVQGVGGNAYDTNASDRMDARKIMEKHSAQIIKDAGDEAVLALLLENERDTEIYAEALGIVGLSAGDKAAEVKRRKDKIEARLKRLGSRL